MFENGQARLVMQPAAMRELIQGPLFNLTVSDRPGALAALRKLPQVKQSSVFGAGIHVLTKTPGDRDGIRVVMKIQFVAIGITGYRINPG